MSSVAKQPLEVMLAGVLARFLFALYKVKRWWRHRDVDTIDVVDIEQVDDITYRGRVLLMHRDGEILHIIEDTVTYHSGGNKYATPQLHLCDGWWSRFPAWFLDVRPAYAHLRAAWYLTAWREAFYTYLESERTKRLEAHKECMASLRADPPSEVLRRAGDRMLASLDQQRAAIMAQYEQAVAQYRLEFDAILDSCGVATHME